MANIKIRLVKFIGLTILAVFKHDSLLAQKTLPVELYITVVAHVTELD